MTGPRVPLPIGINGLQIIIEYGMTYVDKTTLAAHLAGADREARNLVQADWDAVDTD